MRGIKVDKVEKTRAYKACVEEAERIADEMVGNFYAERYGEEHRNNRGLGTCHLFWGFKKQVLKEKFNIDWKTPSEINPHIKFD